MPAPVPSTKFPHCQTPGSGSTTSMRILLAFLLALPLRAELDTAPLAAWLQRHGEIRSLSADFVQQRTLPALKRPVETPGTLAMTRDGKLRWELGDPPKTVAVSDGDTIILADIEEKRARRIDADDSRARSFTMLSGDAMRGGLEGFLEVFEPIESRVVNGIYQLTTRPNNRRMRNKVGWVYFDIDPRKSELRALEIRLDDKSRIKTIFSNTRFNPEIPDSRFRFDLGGYSVR